MKSFIAILLALIAPGFADDIPSSTPATKVDTLVDIIKGYCQSKENNHEYIVVNLAEVDEKTKLDAHCKAGDFLLDAYKKECKGKKVLVSYPGKATLKGLQEREDCLFPEKMDEFRDKEQFDGLSLNVDSASIGTMKSELKSAKIEFILNVKYEDWEAVKPIVIDLPKLIRVVVDLTGVTKLKEGSTLAGESEKVIFAASESSDFGKIVKLIAGSPLLKLTVNTPKVTKYSSTVDICDKTKENSK
ncbi:hypothetical protein DSO57_1037328 [Entomophthora muscae]|uniref:Uncharacterized protein n=1 Tax=Entomophthora muscae TaxID=34485 RepID=A0ACC2RDQ4_9FUNG|nr:hypothetical protein DSO57_1037328 [Entomophthora muscae]